MLLKLLIENPSIGITLLVCLIFSLCFHEFSHGYVAYKLGDKTAYYKGRLTLNPIAHLDPIGSLMLLIVGFGWAKPVPVNPINLQDPDKDMIKVAFAGPASNFLLCILGCILFRLLTYFNLDLIAYPTAMGYKTNIIGNAILMFSQINIILGVFNMLPIYPLDGGQIFGGVIRKYNPKFEHYLRLNGPIILIGIVFVSRFLGIPILGYIFSPFYFLVEVMTGLS